MWPFLGWVMPVLAMVVLFEMGLGYLVGSKASSLTRRLLGKKTGHEVLPGLAGALATASLVTLFLTFPPAFLASGGALAWLGLPIAFGAAVSVILTLILEARKAGAGKLSLGAKLSAAVAAPVMGLAILAAALVGSRGGTASDPPEKTETSASVSPSSMSFESKTGAGPTAPSEAHRPPISEDESVPPSPVLASGATEENAVEASSEGSPNESAGATAPPKRGIVEILEEVSQGAAAE